MQLTPEQRQAVSDAILDLAEDYPTSTVRRLVDEIADAAINAILPLASPPCAEVVTGASDGVPSQIKNDPANYQTRATNRENFTEDGTGYFVWSNPGHTCKWQIGTRSTECGHIYDSRLLRKSRSIVHFCCFCGKPLEVIG